MAEQIDYQVFSYPRLLNIGDMECLQNALLFFLPFHCLVWYVAFTKCLFPSPFAWYLAIWSVCKRALSFLLPFHCLVWYVAFTKLEYFYIPTSQPCPNKKAKPFPIKLAFLWVGGLGIKIQFCAILNTKQWNKKNWQIIKP